MLDAIGTTFRALVYYKSAFYCGFLGGLENPTSEIWIEVIERLTNSKDPVKDFIEGQNQGEFKKEDRTIIQRIKIFSWRYF